MQALLNFFLILFFYFLVRLFFSLLSAPLPFFVSFFYVAESATENITAQIQKPALQHNKKVLLSSSKEKPMAQLLIIKTCKDQLAQHRSGVTIWWSISYAVTHGVLAKRCGLQNWIVIFYSKGFKDPLSFSRCMQQTRIALWWPNTANMRTRTVKQDLILKARTRLRHDKHNDTREGLKFRKVIRKEKLQRHQWVIGQRKQFF